MDTKDEISLEDHRYFRAHLEHLEKRQPAILLHHLEFRTLTETLRSVVKRAMVAKGNLVMNQGMPEDQADELVMRQIVADPEEPLRLLGDPESRRLMFSLLSVYKYMLPDLPRTYLSQSETTE